MKKTNTEIKIKEEFVGGISIDKYNVPLTNETLERISYSDAILLGAVGGPKWENLSFEKKTRTRFIENKKGIGFIR